LQVLLLSDNTHGYSASGEVSPLPDGQKEILAHHEDMVIAIDEGQMKFQPEGSDEWIHAVFPFWQDVTASSQPF